MEGAGQRRVTGGWRSVTLEQRPEWGRERATPTPGERTTRQGDCKARAERQDHLTCSEKSREPAGQSK